MIGPSPQARGGMATVIATLLEHGYGERGRCRFIATHVDGNVLRKAGRAGAALLQLLLLLARRDVALLHVHVASGVSFWRKSLFIAAARLFGVPVLFHLHGGEFRDFLERRLSGWRRRLAYRLIGASAAAFALTQSSAAWLREQCAIVNVEVFPNPIAASTGRPRAPRGEILFIGRLEEKKGVYDLLRAFAAVLERRPDARLILAGEGDTTGVLALAQALDIAHRLELPGWIDAARKADMLASAAVFVLPSWHEQMPMVVLEAMAAGTPVVATAVGAIPEMLLHGSAGSIIAPRDIGCMSASILRIMDDNILADMYSMTGLERVRSEYMVESVLQRLRRRYEELAA